MLISGVHPMNEKRLCIEPQPGGVFVIRLAFGAVSEAKNFVAAMREQNVDPAERWDRVRRQVESSGSDPLDPSWAE